MRNLFQRQNEINRLRYQLEASGFPRLQMVLIVSMTGGTGFFASYWLQHHGMISMAIRYPIALCIAYLVFLCLLWLWLRTTAIDYADIPDISGLIPTPSGENPISSIDNAGLPDDGNVVAETLGTVAQADEFAIPLLAIFVLGALILSSLWIIYTAPVLFAELLVDGILSASLYRKLRGLETQHWLTIAVRRTIIPFLITAVFLCLGGKAMQTYEPTAKTIWDVIGHYKKARSH